LNNLKTNESLLRALDQAASRKPTEEEIREQRISFVMGSLKGSNTATRAEVQEILAQHDGKRSVK